MNPRWLAIWLVDWPIQRLRNAAKFAASLQPNNASVDREVHSTSGPAIGNAVLLWREDPRRGRMVVAACEQCQSLQIRVGMRLHEATDLLARKKGVRSLFWADDRKDS